MNNTEEKCKNCARYLENKPDGTYQIIDFRANGSGNVYVNENGEQVADIYCDCHPGNDYNMFVEFDDGKEVIDLSDETDLEFIEKSEEGI